MSLIRKEKGETFIDLCCAGMLLNLDESTIRKGLCGTDVLTQVRVGRRVRLILEEVVELKAQWIAAARKQPEKRRLRLVG